MKIITVTGCPRVGKDTFLTELATDSYSFSTIDDVKRIARTIGWDGKKDDKGRKFLSSIKDAMTEYNNGPMNTVIKQINDILFTYGQFDIPTQDLVFFVQAREPDEIQRFVDEYNAKALLIRRPAVETTHGNHADDNVFDFDYHYTFYNDSLDTLKERAKAFLEEIKKEPWHSSGPGLDIWDKDSYIG